MQICTGDSETVYLFDIHVLGAAAFTRLGPDVLRNRAIVKLMWDTRSDVDALFHHFGQAVVGSGVGQYPTQEANRQLED